MTGLTLQTIFNVLTKILGLTDFQAILRSCVLFWVILNLNPTVRQVSIKTLAADILFCSRLAKDLGKQKSLSGLIRVRQLLY